MSPRKKKFGRPSTSLYVSDAPHIRVPTALAISPHTTVVLPVHKSVWAAPSLVYVVTSSIMIILLWWALTTEKARKHKRSHNRTGVLLSFITWLLIGLILVLTLCHNDKVGMAWIIVFISLIPAVVVLYQIPRRVNQLKYTIM